MKILNALLIVFLLVATSFSQTWLQPTPTTKFYPTQSIQYITTNLFLNSFYLGGTTGTNGYFIWNGVRFNDPSIFTNKTIVLTNYAPIAYFRNAISVTQTFLDASSRIRTNIYINGVLVSGYTQ